MLLRTNVKKSDSSGHEYDSWTGQRTFAEDTVVRIALRDGLWNGTLLGLGAGLAVSAALLLANSCAPFPYDLCYNSYGVFPLAWEQEGRSVALLEILKMFKRWPLPLTCLRS